MKNNKLNILFLQPLCHEPDSSNFRDRFEMLSQYFEGHVFSLTTQSIPFADLNFGDFKYHAVKFHQNKALCYWGLFTKVFGSAIALHRIKKFDIIHSYDPLVFGLLAILLNFKIKGKVIVEINGHLAKDGFLEEKGTILKIKKILLKFVVHTTIAFSDHIKLLNAEQKQEWKISLKNKGISIFHDYVPTHIFENRRLEKEDYILCMGYPFYRKGVDILIKSFLTVSERHPDTKLKIIGYCPGGDTERQKYIDMAGGNRSVEILKPVSYKEAVKYIEECRIFILPSRSEAMGRVLIEAMAAGKPVIGSRVGGIQDIIKDEYNGFLFESENINELSDKIEKLLSDDSLCRQMGKRSLEFIEKHYSSQNYVDKFVRMIEKIV